MATGENGTNIRIKLAGNVIAGKLSSTFTSNRDEIDLSDADDGTDSKYTMGRRRGEITGEFNLATTGTNDLNDLWDYHASGESVAFIYGGTDSGDFVLEGDAKIRDVEMSDPDNERSTVSVTLRQTGAITKGTYS